MAKLTNLEWRVCAPIHAMNGCTFGVILSALGIDRDSAIIALNHLIGLDYVDMKEHEGQLKFVMTETGKEAYYKWLGF